MKKPRYIDVILTFNITFYLIIVLNPAYSLELPEIPPRPSLKELKSSLSPSLEMQTKDDGTKVDKYINPKAVEKNQKFGFNVIKQ